jgi:hypothetical protein
VDGQHLEPRRRDTSRKSVWLSDQARQTIQQWADENGTSFSAAIETLARLGMNEPAATAMTAMIVSTVRHAVANQMQRFSRLSATAAIQSGIAVNLSRAALRLTVQNRARARPADFEDSIFMVDDGDRAEQAYKRICTAARIDAVARLRDPLEEMLRDLVALAEVPDGHR